MKHIEVSEYKPRPWHTDRSLCGNRSKPWQVIHNRVIVGEFASRDEAIEAANKLREA